MTCPSHAFSRLAVVTDTGRWSEIPAPNGTNPRSSERYQTLVVCICSIKPHSSPRSWANRFHVFSFYRCDKPRLLFSFLKNATIKTLCLSTASALWPALSLPTPISTCRGPPTAPRASCATAAARARRQRGVSVFVCPEKFRFLPSILRNTSLGVELCVCRLFLVNAGRRHITVF